MFRGEFPSQAPVYNPHCILSHAQAPNCNTAHLKQFHFVALTSPPFVSSFGGQGTLSYGAALGGSSLYGSSHFLQTRSYNSSNGNILDFTIDALKSMQSDDKDVLILKLQNDLLEAQRGHQDSLNSTAMLSASNVSLKEEVCVYTSVCVRVYVCVYNCVCACVLVNTVGMRGRGLGSKPIFKKFNEPYAPS